MLPPGMPRKVDLSSRTSESEEVQIELEEEKRIDSEVAALLQRFVEACGKFSGFLGARNGCINVKQRLRLSQYGPKSHAANWAAIYGTRVSAFLFFSQSSPENDEGLAEWLHQRQLMPLARAVFQYLDREYLLTSEPDDVGNAIDSAVVPFLKLTLSAWFATAPSTGEDAWLAWAEEIGVDEDIMKKQLRPALDCVLESLLRMWKALNPVFKRPAVQYANITSVGHLVKECVPPGLLKHLPMTQNRLEKYWSSKAAPASSKKGYLSLTAKTTALRPT